MNVLHICNDFCGSKVHQSLYSALDKKGIEQTIYTYYRHRNLYKKNIFDANNTRFIYSNILRFYHRIFYLLKIKIVYQNLYDNIDLTSFDIIHATTLFSDGAIAYRIYKYFNIPYIVTIRNTDINVFLKYAFYTWPEGRRILLSASKIIFISDILKQRFLNHAAIKDIVPQISDRILVQPNGIDDYWINHIRNEKKNNNNVLYVGKFDQNKNVIRLIKAILKVKKFIPDIHLDLVGGNGCQEKKIKKLVQKYSDVLFYYGEIFDRGKLQDIYSKNSVFAMPSIHETFGLVYLEALSQNLSILYTRNEGVDGLFDVKVGEAVDPTSIDEIAKALLMILNNREAYVDNTKINFDSYRWSTIADLYMSLYSDLIKK